MYTNIGPRQAGKTTNLIILSYEKNIPIAVYNTTQRNRILERAKQMEMVIPMPLLFGNLRGSETILIDDLEQLSKRLILEKLGITKVEGYTQLQGPIL